jgi:hypothetical protein
MANETPSNTKLATVIIGTAAVVLPAVIFVSRRQSADRELADPHHIHNGAAERANVPQAC